MIVARSLVLVALVVLLVVGARPALAQTPINPTTVAFDHADYASTDHYVLGYFASATAAAPVQEATLPKPASCTPCSGALVSRPTAFQNWWVAARAVAGGLTSPWSNRVPFDRVPVAPVISGLK